MPTTVIDAYEEAIKKVYSKNDSGYARLRLCKSGSEKIYAVNWLSGYDSQPIEYFSVEGKRINFSPPTNEIDTIWPNPDRPTDVTQSEKQYVPFDCHNIAITHKDN